MKKLNYKFISLVIGLIAISGLAVYYVFAAWAPPTAAPPGANVPAPINVSTTTQAFLGGKRLDRATTADVLSLGPGLGVDGVLRGWSNLIVDGRVGIGTTDTTTGRLVVSGGNIDVTNNRITNVATPIAASDAATRGFVEAATVSCGCASLVRPCVNMHATCPVGWSIAGWGLMSYGSTGTCNRVEHSFHLTCYRCW